MFRPPYKWFALALLIIVLDQASKLIAESILQFEGQSEAFIPWLKFTLAYNTGAAWSLFSNFGGAQRWFLAALSLLVAIAISFWITRLKAHERFTAVAFACVLGGAVGNLIDRVLYGHVIDFIDFFYKSSDCLPLFYSLAQRSCHWPTFNIADSAISIGAVCLILGSFLDREEKPTE